MVKGTHSSQTYMAMLQAIKEVLHKLQTNYAIDAMDITIWRKVNNQGTQQKIEAINILILMVTTGKV